MSSSTALQNMLQPWTKRITIGPKGLANGKAEWVRRVRGEKREIDLHKTADIVAESVLEERR